MNVVIKNTPVLNDIRFRIALCVILYIAVVYLIVFFCLVNYGGSDENSYLSTLDLIRSYGYEGQEYEIRTEDGFPIKLHRIMSRQPLKWASPVIAIIAPFTMSTRDLVYYSSKEYAYQFADEGYDVWLANVRGLDKSSGVGYTMLEQLSDLSYREQGKYDVPAIIDNILRKTNSRQLQVVAPGTVFISLMVTLAIRPEYNAKISKVISLRYPIKYPDYLDMITKQLSGYQKTLGFYEHLFTWLKTNGGQRDSIGDEKLTGYSFLISKYDFSNIKVPVKIYAAENDMQSFKESEKKILELVPNLMGTYFIKGDINRDLHSNNNETYTNFIENLIETLNKDV